MDEAKLREQIIRELETERYKKEQDERERQRLNAAMNPMLQSARRLENSAVIREDYGARPGEAARAYGTVLAMQMLAGETGTGLADDGYGGEAA